jgi:hypothetical protein
VAIETFGRYEPIELPTLEAPFLSRAISEEFRKIADAFRHQSQQYIYMESQAEPPPILVDGMMVRADGTNWDPGYGAGMYSYFNGVWNYMDGETAIALQAYDAEPARAARGNVHGGILALATAQPLNAVPTNLVFTTGIGKFFLIVNAGSDTTGTVTVTGDSVDRDTGVITRGDTETLTLAGLSTDTSSTDANGNVIYGFDNGYLTSKWFTGSITLSTTNLTLTDVDVWHCSFEQFNDSPVMTINTFDINLLATNAAAEFDGYLYSVENASGVLTLTLLSELHVGTAGEPVIANKYYRLREGNLDKALDGSTDGVFVNLCYASSPAWIEDVTAKAWGTKTHSVAP